jgi:hypothetical protein
VAKRSSLADELIAEGLRLARPCLLLGSWQQGEVTGYWGGKGPRRRPDGPGIRRSGVRWKHRVSVDCAWLVHQRIIPDLHEGTHLGIYERQLPRDSAPARYSSYGSGYLPDGRYLSVVWQRGRLADAGIEGEPLFAKEAESFPPFEAVCLHGGPAVGEWIASLGLRRVEYHLGK